ncbi:MAG: PHP domain-containing protein [Planctomycetota bacterium]
MPARADLIADLHIHSVVSDGECSPEQVVDLVAAAGFSAMALTDHDTVAGLNRAKSRGLERSIEVFSGCELTAYEGSIELHILALMVDVASESPFIAFLEKLQKARRVRAQKIIEKLRAVGIAIDESDVLNIAKEATSIGRPHVAAALVKRGHAPSLQVATTRFLQENGPGYVSKTKLTPDDIIAAVHASGGVAILAHPGSKPHDELIASLFQRGLDGLEAYSSAHSETNCRFYAGLAHRYEKVITGGSDFHGPTVKPGVQIGSNGVDRAMLARLRREAERRRALLAAR